jgi:hypothetical protein
MARAAVDKGEVQRVADRLLQLWVSALRERHGVDIGTLQPQPPPTPERQRQQRGRGRGLPPLRWTSPPRSPVISTARRRRWEAGGEGGGDHEDEEGSAGGGVVGEGEERKPLVGLVGIEAPAGLPQTFMVRFPLRSSPTRHPVVRCRRTSDANLTNHPPTPMTTGGPAPAPRGLGAGSGAGGRPAARAQARAGPGPLSAEAGVAGGGGGGRGGGGV